MRFAGVSLFTQTVALLLLALIMGQAVAVALIFNLPPPRPDIVSLNELVDALRTSSVAAEDRASLVVSKATARPAAPGGNLAQQPAVNRLLSERLVTAPDRVHLYFDAERGSRWLARFGPRDRDWRGERTRNPQSRNDPFFVGPVQADWFDGQRWVTVKSLPEPFFNAWQKRILLWFLLTSLSLVPMAWLFARQMTRPIRGFADAAERMGRDDVESMVPEQGPAELRLAARALNRMQARIDAYLGERTAMIGAIAHDLRTPLSRIAFRIEGIDPAIRDKVQDDIGQMQAMIADTMAFVRGAAILSRAEPLDLGLLLEASAATFTETGKSVSFAGPAAPVTVTGDRVALDRLFTNLIANAVRFGTRASIDLSIDGTIEIADNGPGMSAEMLERAFDPFERGEPSRNRETGGAGLGLAIARAIAAGHGGMVALANREGSGLVATVKLPIANTV